MKKRKLLGKNMTFLISGVLAVMAFTKENIQFWGLVGVFTVWVIWTAGIFLSNKKQLKKVITGRKVAETLKMFTNDENTQTPKDEKTVSSGAEENNDTLLMQHLNCRISDYLKSVYPDITWEWVSENPLKIVKENDMGTIRLFGVPDFNQADIKFDSLGRIKCNMIRVVSFDDLKNTGASKPVNTPKPDNQSNPPIDAETWYGIKVKKVLEKCVADLNSCGHANLIIKENGDICVQKDNKETVCDKFRNLPGKNLWDSLVKVIIKSGLSAAIENDCIKVSW